MDFEKIKERVGCKGKSQQWQYGFDLAIRELQQAKKVAVPECKWIPCYDGSAFNTNCGHTFELSNSDSLADNNMRNCCFCGGLIEAQEN